MHQAIAEAINQVYSQKHNVIPILINNIKEVLIDDSDGKIEAIDKQLMVLQKELIMVLNNEQLVEELGN